MSIWNKPLNRDTFDDFFHLFAPAAYRSAYRILGDSTRTENALTEAFMEVYQKRNIDENTDFVFLFSDILQNRVEQLARQYPLSETQAPKSRALDEFTENAILNELHRRLDSAPFRLVEAFTSSATTLVSSHSEPFVAQIQKTGVSILLLVQLIIAGLIIAAVTTMAGRLFGVTGLAPKTPEKQEVGVMDAVVVLLDYLPLQTFATDPAAPTVVVDPNATTVSTDSQLSSDVVTEPSTSATVSATRG